MYAIRSYYVIDGRPQVIRKTCDDALKRLQTDVIVHSGKKRARQSAEILAQLLAPGLACRELGRITSYNVCYTKLLRHRW